MEMYENGWESDLRCRALRKVGILPHLITPSLHYPCSSPRRYSRGRRTGLLLNNVIRLKNLSEKGNANFDMS